MIQKREKEVNVGLREILAALVTMVWFFTRVHTAMPRQVVFLGKCQRTVLACVRPFAGMRTLVDDQMVPVAERHLAGVAHVRRGPAFLGGSRRSGGGRHSGRHGSGTRLRHQAATQAPGGIQLGQRDQHVVQHLAFAHGSWLRQCGLAGSQHSLAK